MLINAPTDLIAQIQPIASGFISDISPFLTLILGVLLGLFIIGFLLKIMGFSREWKEWSMGATSDFSDISLWQAWKSRTQWRGWK